MAHLVGVRVEGGLGVALEVVVERRVQAHHRDELQLEVAVAEGLAQRLAVPLVGVHYWGLALAEGHGGSTGFLMRVSRRWRELLPRLLSQL